MGTASTLRFRRVARGVLAVTVDGVTYTARYYPGMAGPSSRERGWRSYWTIQRSDRDYTSGNDWYEPNEARVRESIAAVVAQIKRGS